MQKRQLEIRRQLENIEAASSGHETVSSDRYRSYYACLFIVFGYSASSLHKLVVSHSQKFKLDHPRKHYVCARNSILFLGFERDVCANGCFLSPRKVLSRIGLLSSKSATPHGFKQYHNSDSNDKFVRDLNDSSPPVPNDPVCDFRVEAPPRAFPVMFWARSCGFDLWCFLDDVLLVSPPNYYVVGFRIHFRESHFRESRQNILVSHAKIEIAWIPDIFSVMCAWWVAR